MKRQVIIIGIVFYHIMAVHFSFCNGRYIYPVACLPCCGSNKIMVMAQEGNRSTLYLWDSQIKTTQKLLWSAHTPVGVKVLPSRKGFSFIQDGHICTKYFINRSVHAVEFFEPPIYGIEEVYWLDDENCFFHAKQGNSFSIYEASVEGDVERIMEVKGNDCMYPSKVGDALFFLLRQSKPSAAAICKCTYEKMAPGEAKAYEVLYSQADSAIMHLSMHSETEGFFITHESTVLLNRPCVPFNFYQLYYQNDRWQASFLFTFEIPTDLLFGPERIHESVLPLLPRQAGRYIYFVTTVNAYLAIHSYDLDSGTIKRHAQLNRHIFVPLSENENLWYGGSLKNKEEELGFIDGAFFLFQVHEGACCAAT